MLDATIVTVAAPVIHRDLGGPDSDIQWFSAAYTLPFAVLLIPGGRLGDMLGRRRMFTAGVAGFVLASVTCAFATGPGPLIATRAVRGAAAALIIPQTIGLIRAMFDGPELAKAMGGIGPVMGLAAICGPALGAVLTHADLFGASWRTVFLVNVPLGALVLATVPVLRENKAAEPVRLDLPGTGLVMLGTGLIVYPLIQGDTVGWPGWTWAAMAAGVAVLAVFGVHQRHRARRGRSPLVESCLFAGRAFPAALVTSTLFFAVMNGLMVVIVLQTKLGQGSDVLTAGLTLLPWSAAMAVASWIAGTRLVPRYGDRVMFAGLAALLAGILAAIAVYHAVRPGAYPWALLAALSLGGAVHRPVLHHGAVAGPPARDRLGGGPAQRRPAVRRHPRRRRARHRLLPHLHLAFARRAGGRRAQRDPAHVLDRRGPGRRHRHHHRPHGRDAGPPPYAARTGRRGVIGSFRLAAGPALRLLGLTRASRR